MREPRLLQQWRDFRQHAREALAESNRSHHETAAAGTASPGADPDTGSPSAGNPGTGHASDPLTGPPESGAAAAAEPASATTSAHPSAGSGTAGHPVEVVGLALPEASRAHPEDPAEAGRFGALGKPLNRQSPFYLGFFGALGALIAVGLWHSVARLASTITILLVAFFLTLALSPLVEFLIKRRFSRSLAVTTVFAGVIVVFVLLGLVVVPPVVSQATELTQAAPDYVNHLAQNPWLQQIDSEYQVVSKVQEEITKRAQDPNFLSQIFGGVLGAGKAVAGGVFTTLTVLILTLYFLASLPKVKQSAYAMVPASRRVRVASLSEEIMRRTGSYAIGQVAIATLNAILSWVMMSIVGIPYAAVLAVAVGFLGLIPMVGATLGAALVCLVALFNEPRQAVIALIYYVIYQQVENYVIAPRIMQRTVSVPGAVTVVAALAGASLLGMLGALLGIPVAAGLLLLYEEVLLPRQRRH